MGLDLIKAYKMQLWYFQTIKKLACERSLNTEEDQKPFFSCVSSQEQSTLGGTDWQQINEIQTKRQGLKQSCKGCNILWLDTFQVLSTAHKCTSILRNAFLSKWTLFQFLSMSPWNSPLLCKTKIWNWVTSELRSVAWQSLTCFPRLPGFFSLSLYLPLSEAVGFLPCLSLKLS